MITINNAVNTLVHNEYTQQKLTRLDSSKNIKQQLNNIFFTAINLEKNKEINTSQQHKSIQNESFYDKISTAKLYGIKRLLIIEVETFIELDKFYCGDANHLAELNLFKKKILNQSPYTNVENDMKNTLYSIYKLNRVLKNLQYEIQTQTSTIISKDAISLRLDECLGGLDKCWPGIYSRLQQEYDFLSANQQGLLGIVYTIKKNIFREIAVKYISVNNPNLSGEVHTFNRYNNAVAKTFGLNIIEDANATTKLDTKTAKEFTALLEIELSPTAITAKLAENIYNKLAEVLAKFDMHSWLIKDITDSELKFTPEEIDNIVFAPINALFNITATQKLTINKIIDFYEKNENSMYSLKYSKEKINLWLADNIIPNSSEILVSSIENSQENKDFSIKTIGGIFFWVCYQQDNNNKIDYDDYIPLQLSHLMQVDFASLCKVKDKQIIIDLVIQARSQTNNLVDIFNFVVNDNIQLVLENTPLLKQKFKDKLANENFIIDFKIFFSTANPIQTIKYFLSLAYDKGAYTVASKIIIDILNNNKISIIEKTTILQTKATNGKSLLFLLSTKDNQFINNYLNLILDNIDFTNEQKLELISREVACWLKDLLSIVPDKVKQHYYKSIINYFEIVLANYNFSYLQKIEIMIIISKSELVNDNATCKIASKFINDFLTSKKITTAEKIDTLHTKATSNMFLLFLLSNNDTKYVSDYVNFILSSIKLTDKQKLDFLKKEITYYFSIYDKHNYHEVVSDYFNIVLAYNGFNYLQKIEIIKIIGEYTLKPYTATLKVASKFINDFLTNNKITTTEKIDMLRIKETGSMLLLFPILNDDIKCISNYVNLILNSDNFTNEKKLTFLIEDILYWSEYLYLNTFEIFNVDYSRLVSKPVELVLDYDGFTSVQKIGIITTLYTHPNIYLGSLLGNTLSVKNILYIKYILKSNCFTPEKKLAIILEKQLSSSPAPSVPRNEKYDNEQEFSEYIKALLSYPDFTPEDKLKIIMPVRHFKKPSLFSEFKTFFINKLSRK